MANFEGNKQVENLLLFYAFNTSIPNGQDQRQIKEKRLFVEHNVQQSQHSHSWFVGNQASL